MPLFEDVRRVMVVGSGPIVIGQAAEFDYAGTQACQALKEEGIFVILLNSNPATIMTDAEIAHRVYLEPLTVETARDIIAAEKPDGLLATLGGQVGLNLAVELAQRGVLDEFGVKLLGTPLASIQMAEDRLLFKEAMARARQPVPHSAVISSWSQAKEFAEEVGLPLVVRPAYTLGGTGGGFAATRAELEAVVARGLKHSPIQQVLLEKSVAGWKEIEFEVMRDQSGTAVSICAMENIDPMGIHTGDSVVVAPTLTLTDRENQMLRRAALDIIEVLGIAGGCNVQFALNPITGQYMVIEVNPRVSRSSALASKATGYPIAMVATKIAVGLTLDEITNPITGNTSACFEPAIDYVVLKYPRWPFDKMIEAERVLGTQMKATGEVMAIDRSFEGALQKAIRSAEVPGDGLSLPELQSLPTDALWQQLVEADDRRLFVLAELLRRGVSPADICQTSHIAPFFVEGIRRLIAFEADVIAHGLTDQGLRQAKRLGFSDQRLAALIGCSESAMRSRRLALSLRPAYKMVDTCAAEFEAATPYFYSTYRADENEAVPSKRDKVVVLGSGPIRIGQGIEFDYSAVHAVNALRQAGLECIMINNNPETVSTDFNTADRLYFEPLTAEDVTNILDLEKPQGVMVQFGGQTALSLAAQIAPHAPILGTSLDSLDRSEDRQRFDLLLADLGIARPPGGTACNWEQASAITDRIGFPVLVRPSYVLGGQFMRIIYDDLELQGYLTAIAPLAGSHPVFIDHYVEGVEVEVDAVSDGREVVIPAIMEHVERAGVHSGDSIALCPAQSLSPEVQFTIVDYVTRLAKALQVRGLMNVQLVVKDDTVQIIEANLRSSRTVPFLTKVTGLPMVQLATRIMLGNTLEEMGIMPGLMPIPSRIAAKVPVFSWAKLRAVDTALSPEMKSTGEVIGMDDTAVRAIYKGLLAAGVNVPTSGQVLFTIADRDKEASLPLARSLVEAGYQLLATQGTTSYLLQHGLPVTGINKRSEGSPHVIEAVTNGQVVMVLNTLSPGQAPARDGYHLRRAATEFGIPCLTSLDTATVAVAAFLDRALRLDKSPPMALQELRKAVFERQGQ